MKRMGDPVWASERFAPVLLSTLPLQTVGFLAKAACAEFGWGPATHVTLFLVPFERARAVERDASNAEDLLRGDPLFSGDTLCGSGVASGSWLVARITLLALPTGARTRALMRAPRRPPAPPPPCTLAGVGGGSGGASAGGDDRVGAFPRVVLGCVFFKPNPNPPLTTTSLQASV